MAVKYISKVDIDSNQGIKIKDADCRTNLSLLTTNVGPLSNLQTNDKSSIVNAINEVLSTGNDSLEKIDNLMIINVRDLGAKGDDSTVDNGAFNNAIALINNGSAKGLYIPAGTYKITGNLTPITTGCVIFGQGSNSVIHITSGSGALFDLSGWTNGIMRNLKFDDDSARNPLIHVGTGNEILFESLWVEDSDCMFEFGASSDTTVSAYNATIKDVFGWVHSGFSLLYGSRSCVHFENCVINSERTYSGSCAIYVDDKVGLDTLEVRNCLFQRFYYGIITNTPTGVTTSNYFIDGMIIDGYFKRGIQFNSTGHVYRININNSWFASYDGTGTYEAILCNATSAKGIAGVQVSNCEIPFCYYVAMTFVNCEGVGVVDCKIPMYSTAGISLTNTGAIKINDNSIGYDGTNSTPAVDPAIAFNSCHDIVVCGNYCSVATILSSLTNYKVTGNYNIADGVG